MLERSSNEIVSMLFPGTVLGKPSLRNDLVDQAIKTLPVAGEYEGVVGSGDYDHRKSSEGAVILNYSSHIVAKVPLGESYGDPLLRAQKMRDSYSNFSVVSPETMVIIARIDDGGPKPVVLQKEICGKTICDVPLINLLRLDTLRDIRQILSRMKGWYREKGAYDLCGQRTSNTLLGGVVQLAPTFSDNIMIDTRGHAYLVDNILDSTVKIDTPKRKYRDFLRKNLLHWVPLIIIDTLIVAVKAYDRLFTEESL